MELEPLGGLIDFSTGPFKSLGPPDAGPCAAQLKIIVMQ